MDTLEIYPNKKYSLEEIFDVARVSELSILANGHIILRDTKERLEAVDKTLFELVGNVAWKYTHADGRVEQGSGSILNWWYSLWT